MTGRIGWGMALVALMLAGCGSREPAVTDGWIRLAANPGAPASGYFTLHGGGAPATLVAVSTGAAQKAEMHETQTTTIAGGSVTVMSPIGAAVVPASGEVSFRPGGHHIMLIGVDKRLTPGGTVPMTFTFEDRHSLTAPMKIVGAGDQAPY